jgi:CHAT domain-containing protein/Tfp pilus assembly protein PilF
LPAPCAHLLLGCAVVLRVAPAPPPPGPGLVVEQVERGRSGDRAGLRAGDGLVAWARASGPGAPAGGVFTTPADLAELEDVQAPLGPVTLHVLRASGRQAVSLDSGEFGLRARTSLSAPVLTHYERGQAAPRAERARAFRQAADEARRRHETAAAFWLLLETSRLSAETRDREAALSALEEARTLAGENQVLEVQALEVRSRALQALGSPGDAEPVLQQALRLRQLREPDGLSAASGLEALGALAWSVGDPQAAERHHSQALLIREARAPGTIVYARSLRQVANIHWGRGDLTQAETLVERAFAIAAAREPEGRTVANTVNTRGNIAHTRGRYREAAADYRRVVELRGDLEPWSTEVCFALGNLGLLAFERGELEAAEQMFERSWQCLMEARPGAPLSGHAMERRGLLAVERGDYAAARQFFLQALAMAEKQQADESFLLHNLGEVALAEGDLAGARGYLERALPILERKYGQESTWYANGLEALGDLARRGGDLAVAQTTLERSLAIHDKVAPDGLGKARSLQLLARIVEAAGDQARAQELYEAALGTFRLLAPGTYLEAQALHGLGRLHLAGDGAAAAALLRQAVDAMESSALRAGGGQEARSSFRARHAEIYRDLTAAELRRGRVDEALHVVERSRGRVLLEWLARRSASAALDVSADLQREAEENNAEYERVQARLQQLRPGRDAEEIARLVARLRELQQARARWFDRLRERSPRYAALQYPAPLDAAEISRALDPGTVLLSYSVGARATLLFVVGAGAASPRVYTIPVGAEELQRRVSAFRKRIDAARSGEAGALRREARALFDLLLGPAHTDIEAAARVLICPDGPLHVLPFAALATRERYLVEWRPLHFVNSVTVYVELQRSRRDSAGARRLVAFGDPRPHPSFASQFPPLPGSRREVRAVQLQVPARAAVYLGAEATEGRARSLGRDVPLVHFASHARIDERFPLDSALVLSPGPGDENGLLQAWEIFDGMRLDSDLVTLSACETALGKDMAGEGLLGLTRAFLYAGARSVLASLWRVSDKITPDLMRRFYRHLARGEPKDEALRAAQMEMIRAGGAGAHPFGWAAFQVFGDWR